ncbi:MAG TPA: pyrroloquinoline quinone biosynthesis protein PqqB [Ktedonobacteraceae bacterium]|nr:pyrroloquinoline quinone biosynthesis protein PqqB [Ktedonobacteraceae bacterium]
MYIRLLGTAAGGGFPQWNCNCQQCLGIRQGKLRAQARTQSSVTVSADGQRWFLLNASPDVRQQIDAFPPLAPPMAPPPGKVRASSIAGIFLTDADLDHTLGLLILREGLQQIIYATEPVRQALTRGLMLLPALQHYCDCEWREPSSVLAPLFYSDGQFSGLNYTACFVKGHAPRYMGDQVAAQHGDRVGYYFVDVSTGGRFFYLPGLAALETSVWSLLKDCDLLLLDGTFWSETEMQETATGSKSASAMGHLPVGGPYGSLLRIATLPIKHKVYVHINNTNPMLIEDSHQATAVREAGIEIGRDGMEFVL